MKVKAAIRTELGEPLVIDYVDLAPPKANEVLVKIGASGVCHSDLNSLNDPTLRLPNILGHEGSGTVVEIGPNVRSVKVGDKVALSWIPYCGVCLYCKNGEVHLCETAFGPIFDGTLLDGTSRLSRDGETVYHDSVLSTFAEYAVVSEMSCVKIPDEMPFAQAALLGCGVATGYGAAVYAAGVTSGSTVAVFGIGGVGVNAIQGARIVGASKIIACDLKDQNLEIAKKYGATHTINVGKEDVVEVLKKLTGGYGVDYAIDATGNTNATVNAWLGTRRGGTTVAVGWFNPNKELNIPAKAFHRQAKILKGSLYGNINPLRDIAILAQHYLDGKLLLDELILERITLEEINNALDSFHDCNCVNVGRSVIVFK